MPKPAFPALPRVAWVGRFGEGWNSGFQGTAKPLFQASLEPPEYPLRRARNRGFQDPGIGLPGQVSRVLGSGSWDPGKPSPGLPQGFPRASPGPWKPPETAFFLKSRFGPNRQTRKKQQDFPYARALLFWAAAYTQGKCCFFGKVGFGRFGPPQGLPSRFPALPQE